MTLKSTLQERSRQIKACIHPKFYQTQGKLKSQSFLREDSAIILQQTNKVLLRSLQKVENKYFITGQGNCKSRNHGTNLKCSVLTLIRWMRSKIADMHIERWLKTNKLGWLLFLSQVERNLEFRVNCGMTQCWIWNQWRILQGSQLLLNWGSLNH